MFGMCEEVAQWCELGKLAGIGRQGDQTWIGSDLSFTGHTAAKI